MTTLPTTYEIWRVQDTLGGISKLRTVNSGLPDIDAARFALKQENWIENSENKQMIGYLIIVEITARIV